MSVEVISKIKPWAGGDFPIADAEDISVSQDERLDEAIERIDNKLVIITQEEYDNGSYCAPEGSIVIVIETDRYELEGIKCCCGCENDYHKDEDEAVT